MVWRNFRFAPICCENETVIFLAGLLTLDLEHISWTNA